MTPFHAIQRTDAHGNVRWVWFDDAIETIQATAPDQVLPALRRLEKAQQAGLNAVGWISYEAAAGFDAHLHTHAPLPDLPLLRFTIYQHEHTGLPYRESETATLSELSPEISQSQFCQAVTQIHQAIAAGETYQVNYTYPHTATLHGDAWSFFRQLRHAQAAQHQAYIEETDQIIISASPERFFRHEGTKICCKPMKGTAKASEAAQLKASLKNRSENIMIVDMIRNDLGKIADKGSVKTDPLFEIEHYPSLVQMTSTVTASGSSSPIDWLQALFPCASITGAPKRKTMEWITQLEKSPRGIYTGAIGGFYADGVSEFNVAIRTAVVNKQTQELRYHSGCGIVWDSDPLDEFHESRLKTAVLHHCEPAYQLIETMRGEPGQGIALWPYHRERLQHSAAALGFELDPAALEKKISSLIFSEAQKVRLTLAMDGQIDIQQSPLPVSLPHMTFQVDSQHTPSHLRSLKHKTTRRDLYQQARTRCPAVDETLLINERGELTEFSIGNLVWEKDGQAFTPPLSSGLLPGVARAAALNDGTITEKKCSLNELGQADHITLINALRGKIQMKWVQK